VPDVTDVQEKPNKNGNDVNLSVTLVMRNNGETDGLGAKAKAAVEATSRPIFADADLIDTKYLAGQGLLLDGKKYVILEGLTK
jgi:hypothetical protein